MRKQILLCWAMIAGFFCITSCNDKNDEFDDKGSCTINSFEGPETAYMGDSINFNFQIAGDGIQLNQSKIQLFFGETIVSERIMLTPTAGGYSGKLLIPFMKNVEDGSVDLKLRIQNERFANAVNERNIRIIRPLFPKLILKDANGVAREMLPSAEDPYKYIVTDIFPSQFFATIEAPKYGQNGNAMVFGNSDGKIANGVSNLIEFTADIDGEYPITFNTKTYEGTPFIKFALNDVEFETIDNTRAKVEMNLKQGQDIQITGLKADYANYWVNPAFFRKVKDTNGKTLRFMGRDGKYRVTVDKSLKYFRVEVMNASGTAIANLANGDDVIWSIGDGNIGQPSFSKNGISWSTGEKVICLAPLGNGKHQLVLEAGTNIKAGSINFKFFYQKGWGVEFTSDKISLEDQSKWFRVNSGDGNIRGGDAALINGKFYIVTVDISEGPTKTKMYVEEADGFDEVDPLP
ncbi:DUF5125 domain-containing protein [Bacteroides sp. UBA939]|uniref:DUF5125 domain-containing protein n=1 Tax=Bacteroides sp. UBA939 TaxID=1946092 RepID=UPI0025BE09D5|nr:DUF5125 domain-containing protein [Bacteroides sp. UBA939]